MYGGSYVPLTKRLVICIRSAPRPAAGRLMPDVHFQASIRPHLLQSFSAPYTTLMLLLLAYASLLGYSDCENVVKRLTCAIGFEECFFVLLKDYKRLIPHVRWNARICECDCDEFTLSTPSQ